MLRQKRASQTACPRERLAKTENIQALPISPRSQSELYLLFPHLGYRPLGQQTTTSSIRMYSSGAPKSQIRCLTKSRNHSVNIVVSLQAQVPQSVFAKAGAPDSSVAGSVLIISPDTPPLYFFTVLLKIKFNKNTLPTANFHSSPELHTAWTEFKVPPCPTSPFSLFT